MTATQLFKWFCKEQQITHIIHKMFHEIHPSRIEYGKSGIIRKYLTFEEYINERINSYGFSYLLSRIILDYLNSMRIIIIDWNAYWEFREEFENKLSKYCKRWEYFSKHNILINENSVKIGDNVKFNDWGRFSNIKITSIDILNGKINGIRVSEDGEKFSYCVGFGQLLNEDETPKQINYSIKRNRKIYNGKN